jgi:hypothetical protein
MMGYKTIRRNGGEVYDRKMYRGVFISINNYQQAKERYESVKPIGGIRKKLGGDFRPVADRYRTWEVFMRDGDNYGIGFHGSYIAYDHVKKDDKTISIPKEIRSTPRPILMFSPDGVLTYTPQWVNSYSTWEFLAAALPETLRFTKFGSKQYMEVAQPDGGYMYYLLHKIDSCPTRFIPYENDGKVFFHVHGNDVIREHKILIDREKSKAVRQEFSAFIDYYNIMSALLTVDVTEEDVTWTAKNKFRTMLDEGNWLMRQDGEEYGAKWADAVKAFFFLHSKSTQSWDKKTQGWGARTYKFATVEDVMAISMRDLYRYGKPYRTERVPVGVGFRPNGREE